MYKLMTYHFLSIGFLDEIFHALTHHARFSGGLGPSTGHMLYVLLPFTSKTTKKV